MKRQTTLALTVLGLLTTPAVQATSDITPETDASLQLDTSVVQPIIEQQPISIAHHTPTHTVSEPLAQNTSPITPPETTSEVNFSASPTPTETTDFTLSNSEPLDNQPTVDSLENTLPTDSMDQVTSVSQLRDVEPTDWAFSALQNLVERYNCIAGYPNGTFRGNKPITRYEFAAGLNACLTQLESMMGRGPDVNEGDLKTLQRLVQEFEAELNALKSRVDDLEGRVAFLEDHQFSTTTKLFGQSIIGVQGRTDNNYNYALNRFKDADTQINVITNTQLSLFTQFSERSFLLTGLQAGSGATVINGPALNTFVGLGYEGNTNNDVILSDLSYRQLIGNNFAVVLGTEGISPVNVFRGANRVASAGYGSLSRFALRNPVISVGGSGAGLGFDWQIGDRASFQGVYAASKANDPQKGGLFGGENGSTTFGAQLVVTPVNSVDIAFQYLNSYSPFGFLGTGVGDDQLVVQDFSFRNPMNTNALGVALDWRLTRKVTLGGWFGYTTSDFSKVSGTVETMNWMTYLNFPDLGGEGNLAGIYVGQPPKITDSSLPAGSNMPSFVNKGDVLNAGEGGQPSTTTHLEAFYRFKVNDNISITPGVIVLLNPGHNSNNDTITIGAIRTTFSF